MSSEQQLYNVIFRNHLNKHLTTFMNVPRDMAIDLSELHNFNEFCKYLASQNQDLKSVHINIKGFDKKKPCTFTVCNQDVRLCVLIF